jgi:uncharacterized protein YjiS (DUF1127 family)
MAYNDTHTAEANDLPHRILEGTKAFFGVIGNALVAASSANRRMQLVEHLNAKSDEELAALGLRREDIVRRVFIDMMHV